MTKNNSLITGNIVPTISYFSESGLIEEESCRLQAIHAISHGADALFVLGSTGEGTFLKGIDTKGTYERAKLILITLDAISEFHEKTGKKIPILVGAYGDNAESVQLDIDTILNDVEYFYGLHQKEYHYIHLLLKDKDLESVADELIDGFVVPPPVKTNLNQQELTLYYQDILKKSNFPIYMYNNPGSFAGNKITVDVIAQLKNYEMLKGIKDSSGTLEQKIEYLSYLNEDFSVSCGKEGIIGTFLQNIPLEKRKYAGIVPSLGNLTNNPSKIFNLGLEGKDEEMIDEQKKMNSFRGKIYDSDEPKGKAQRGVKICFKYIYRELSRVISETVRPEFIRNIPDNIIEQMHVITDDCIEKGYIKRVI